MKASASSDPLIQKEVKRRKECASILPVPEVKSASVSSVGQKFPMNIELSSLMNKISSLYEEYSLLDKDQFRSYSYKNVAGRLLYLDFEVCNVPSILRKLSQVRGFGPKIMQRIGEYLVHKKCSLISELESNSIRAAMRNLVCIWGVGSKTAQSWAYLGYKNIEDVRQGLRTGKLNVNKNVRIGVDCYEDFIEKIDRDEVTIIGNIVADTCHERFPNATVTIMGSYRRGKGQCGDVDVLITDPAYIDATPAGALDWLVEALRKKGHITNHLTSVNPSVFHDKEQLKVDSYDEGFDDLCKTSAMYMGVFSSPVQLNRKRRIDIKFYPLNERASAVLYFTGSSYFNRSMRLYAKKHKKCHLDDHGLYGVSSVPGRKGDRILVKTENDIFDALGLEFREPHEREGPITVKGADEPTFIEDEGKM